MSDSESTRWDQSRLVFLVLVAVAILGPPLVIGGFLNNSVPVSDDVTLNATTGPEVNFTNLNTDANLTKPFPNDNTVEWRSGAGNITLSANSQMTVNVDQITGTWTNVSSMGASSVELQINPGDKQRVNVTTADSLSFKDVTVDDGNVDFVVKSSGNAVVNVTGLSAHTAVIAKNETGALIDGDMVDNGMASFTIDTSDEKIFLESSSGSTPSLTNEAPEGRIDTFPSQVNLTVNDADFANDEVDVQFDVNGNDKGTATVTSDGGEASVSISNSPLGESTVTATATDIYGNTNTLSWTFSTPENLTVREVIAPHNIIDDRQVNATFFDGDEIIEKSTTTGNISMEGIPGRENIIVSIDSQTGTSPADYHDVENLVLDFTEQQTAYMLNTGASSRTVRFKLDDRTGGVFEENGGMVLVQKPINRSSFNSPQWETVYADRFGPEGAAGELEDGQRYRIVVRNNDGDERVLGTYTADADETVTLEVGDVTVQPVGNDKEFDWNVTYDKSSSPRFVRIHYNDSEDLTDNIWVEIYEFNNKSNVLASNQSFGGPYGTFSFSEQVPADEKNTTWAVKITLDRGDETEQIIEPVGPTNPVLQSMPNYLKVIISIGSILIVAGLFSQLNGHWGGLVVAAMGAMFWFIDFLPKGTDIGVVVLAMVTAGLIFIRERQVSAV